MSETISPNTTIGQYTIVSKIGEGGTGEVYRASLFVPGNGFKLFPRKYGDLD